MSNPDIPLSGAWAGTFVLKHSPNPSWDNGSTYAYYGLWDFSANIWNDNTTNGEGSHIKVNTTTNEWSDHGGNHPGSTISRSGETITLRNNSNNSIKATFTRPALSTYSSGPTVTSITNDTIFVPSDTVSNTDFTLLKNGSAYANSNISLTGPGAQPPSDARGYTYTLTYDGSAYYDVTVDSKTFFGHYYDDSWISSPTSTRNPLTSSSRILNVIAQIPNAFLLLKIDGSTGTAYTGQLSQNGRLLTYVHDIYASGSITHKLTLNFWVAQKTVNGSPEIVGTFSSKYEQYPPAIDGRSFDSFDYIIGAQQKLTHTTTKGGVTYEFSLRDWIYEDEPEGDGYVAPVSTTSDGGSKPRRYPIISTNLFDRQKTIFSIGLTHKDETLF